MLRAINSLLVLCAVLIGLAAFLAAVGFVFRRAFEISTALGLSAAAVAISLVVLGIWSQNRSFISRVPELDEIFRSFAQRHGLSFAVTTDQAIAFTFEAGGALDRRLLLSIVSDDEFMADYGPHSFRFIYSPERRDKIDGMLDAWVEGRARIVAYSGGGQALELRESAAWVEFTTMNIGPLRGRSTATLANAI